MAQLTWRNVDAPDFSSSTASLRLVGDMINQAGQASSRAIEAYQKDQGQLATGEFMARMNSGMSAQQAMQGLDPQYVNSAALEWGGNAAARVADVANTQARTGFLGQQTENLGQTYLFNEQEQPYVIEQKRLANETTAEALRHDQLNNPLLRTNNDLINQGKVISNGEAAITFNERLAGLDRASQARGIIDLARQAGITDKQGFAQFAGNLGVKDIRVLQDSSALWDQAQPIVAPPVTRDERQLDNRVNQMLQQQGIPNQADGTLGLLRKFEGYRSTPYWDVNAYRTGYGSDTITRPDGSVIKVTPGMQISREDAERDLNRRVNTEFVPGIISKVGQDNWAKLPVLKSRTDIILAPY